MPMIRVRDLRASNDSSFMNGLVARRSSSGAASPTAMASSASPSGILASDVPHRLGHLLLAELALDLFEPLGRRRELLLQFLGALLGADQFLGLTGETLLGDPQDVVEVGAAFDIGDLELTSRLDLLEASVEVGVLLGGAREIGGALVRPGRGFGGRGLHLLHAGAEVPRAFGLGS